MVTREKLEEILGEDKISFKTKGIDYDVKSISLLREKIPYDKLKSIISSAGHDIIYLTNVDITCEYLNEEDLEVLADCNCFIEENHDCLAIFV